MASSIFWIIKKAEKLYAFPCDTIAKSPRLFLRRLVTLEAVHKVPMIEIEIAESA